MCSLGKTLLAFALLHSVLQGQIYLLLHVLLFFFMLQKALLFPFGPRLERGLQGVKKLPSGCREGLQAALMLGGFFNGHWSPEAPSRA